MYEDIKYVTSESNYPFAVEMAGISYCDSSYHIRRKNASVTVIEYVISGTGIIAQDEIKHSASEGDVYMLHQGHDHDYYADEDHPWVKIWINISGPVAQALLSSYKLDHVNLVKDCPANIRLKFESFLDLAKKDLQLHEKLDACAGSFLQIIQVIASHHKRKTNPHHLEAYEVRDFVLQNIDRSVQLQDIADHIYRSKAYTINRFRQVFKMTPYAFLLEKRISAACQLLEETNLSIKAIADHFLFADQHYFSTLFKQKIGVSPSAYRKKFHQQ